MRFFFWPTGLPLADSYIAHDGSSGQAGVEEDYENAPAQVMHVRNMHTTACTEPISSLSLLKGGQHQTSQQYGSVSGPGDGTHHDHGQQQQQQQSGDGGGAQYLVQQPMPGFVSAQMPVMTMDAMGNLYTTSSTPYLIADPDAHYATYAQQPAAEYYVDPQTQQLQYVATQQDAAAHNNYYTEQQPVLVMHEQPVPVEGGYLVHQDLPQPMMTVMQHDPYAQAPAYNPIIGETDRDHQYVLAADQSNGQPVLMDVGPTPQYIDAHGHYVTGGGAQYVIDAAQGGQQTLLAGADQPGFSSSEYGYHGAYAPAQTGLAENQQHFNNAYEGDLYHVEQQQQHQQQQQQSEVYGHSGGAGGEAYTQQEMNGQPLTHDHGQQHDHHQQQQHGYEQAPQYYQYDAHGQPLPQHYDPQQGGAYDQGLTRDIGPSADTQPQHGYNEQVRDGYVQGYAPSQLPYDPYAQPLSAESSASTMHHGEPMSTEPFVEGGAYGSSETHGQQELMVWWLLGKRASSLCACAMCVFVIRVSFWLMLGLALSQRE